MVTLLQNKYSILDMVLAITVFAWILGEAMGYGIGLANNFLCIKYLGCNTKFFGWHSLFEHFPSGIWEAVLIVWLAKRFSAWNILQNSFRKNFFIILAVVTSLGAGFELLELLYDQFRIVILHQYALVLQPALSAQPSVTATMGDIVFTSLGGIVGILILKLFDPGAVSSNS